MSGVIKDMVVSRLIPDTISECAAYLGTAASCISPSTIGALAAALKDETGSTATIVERAKEHFDCDTERCVLERAADLLGEKITSGELKHRFKVKGPTSSNLLSNVNIDAVLQQLASAHTDFYAYNFNMRNYAQYSYVNGRVINKPDSLATVPFADIHPNYKRAACVINTDVYQGEGKHWMALFVDTTGRDWTVEFFNSSGGPPSPEWVNWLEKTRAGLEVIRAGPDDKTGVKIVRVSNTKHQRSRTECGVYSLFYVWARLSGVPIDYFSTTRIADELMFEFRQHLFMDPSRPQLNQFCWDDYKKTTRISWE